MISQFFAESGYVLKFLTNLGSIPVSLIFEHILCPQCYKAQVFYFQTDIVIIGTSHLHFISDKCRSEDLRGVGFSIHGIWPLLPNVGHPRMKIKIYIFTYRSFGIFNWNFYSFCSSNIPGPVGYSIAQKLSVN